MSIKNQLRRSVAAFSASALVLGLGVGAVASAQAVPAPASGIAADTVDYFADVYTQLDSGHVIESVTYERLEFLLNQEGNVPVLIGGPNNVTTQETIAHIDAVAKEYGVSKVYHFNPLLDGTSVDVRDSQIPEVSELWTNLTTNYLNKDTETSFSDAAAAPYFFIYNKDRKLGQAEDRIVAALSGTFSAGELGDADVAGDYRDYVRAVFAEVTPGETPAAVTLNSGQFDFFQAQVNERHQKQYVEAEKYGSVILSDDDADFRIQSITYPELVHILNSQGDYVLFFGGTWCHNTRAVVKYISNEAAANGVETVYNFDLRLDGLSGNSLHIRDSKSVLAHLYGDLVNTYLPNLDTQYRLDGPNPNHQVAYYPGGDTSGDLVKAQKLQVPFLVQYNKDATAGERSAPITRTWIQQNGEDFKEYMTEWWYTIGLNGRLTGQSAETAKAFAAEAVEKVELFFAGDPIPGDDSGDEGGEDGGSEDGDDSNNGSDDGDGKGDEQDDSDDTPAPGANTIKVSGTYTPGGTITIQGSGFELTNTDLLVQVHSDPVNLGTVRTDGSGAFSLTTTLPSNLTPGQHAIVVSVDGDTLVSQAITVAAAPGGAGAGDALAATGANAQQLTVFSLLALVSLVGGVALVVRSRRQQDATGVAAGGGS